MHKKMIIIIAHNAQEMIIIAIMYLKKQTIIALNAHVEVNYNSL